MGANIINTICEQSTNDILRITGGTPGIRIMSNYCTERLTKVKFSIPIDKLGQEVAAKILQGYEFAKSDIYRATTHNKGIMNGIDAVALATG